MADHLGSPPHDPHPKGWLTRARGHLVDVTPLRISRDFRHLFVGRSVSDFGDEIVAVVIPFQVYDLTGSTFAVGMLGLVELVPVFVFPIVGGAFADALERRKLTIATHAILALMSVLMALNSLRDEPLSWPLYAFAFVSAGLYTFNRPALSTWPARLLEPGLLPSANALEAGFGTLDSMLGPVAAGVLLATIAPEGAFLFDALTFLVVIWQIARMRPSPPSDENNDVSWEAIKDGFRFLRGKRTLQTVFLADLNAMVFGFPIALFPAVADRLGGDGVSPELALGLLYAALAAGAFLATLFSGRAKHVHRQGRAILIAVAVWGAAIVGFGLSDALWPALVMLAVAGAGDMVSGIYRSTILQVAVEDRLRGRLEGIGMAVWATGPSVGNVESGVVASLTSVPFSIVSGGLLTVVGVVALRWFAPGFWRYDARNPRI
ncbi:MAG TPA: MFS transporter [Actinomycetota bacterium]|jgi:MFS family permease